MDSAVPAGHAFDKRSAFDDVPAAQFDKSDRVVDTTAGLIEIFHGDLINIRDMSTAPLDVPNPPVVPANTATVRVSEDTCLSDWATRTLQEMDGKSGIATVQTCGLQAAYVFGGYTTSARDLLMHARLNPANADSGQILFTSSELKYASSATSTGEAVIVVVGRDAP
jgi:hypothetical protein